LLRALEATLAGSGHGLADALPVSGLDHGTLEKRLDGQGEAGHVVGKTGTYGEYGASALAGALRTRQHGTVYFAILNHGVPVPVARKRQEAFVRALLARWHTDAWPYRRAAQEPWADALIETSPALAPGTPGIEPAGPEAPR
jgi:serine-type D-Ala-D-Ala carboxypeptidase/endopeptidase (penicillin-binding protein 4)